MDVLKNATNPYFGSTKIAMGNAQIVAAEVLVSKLLRKILGMAPRSFSYLAAVHATSLPLVGGLQAPFSKPVGFGQSVYFGSGFAVAEKTGVRNPKESRSYGTNLDIVKAAAASVPAVWLAEYIVQTSGVGFHVPKPSIRDAFLTAASKILTKPLIGMSFNTILPEAVRRNFEEASALESVYNAASSLGGGRGSITIRGRPAQ